MKLPKLAAALLAASLLTGSAFAMKPVTIVDQGSFLAGGTIVTAPGNYKGSTEPTNNAGETLHGDHAYVFYQKPKNAHHNSLVFLHGYGQSAKTWETTPDGQLWYNNFRIGQWPDYNANAAVPRDEASRDQFFRAMTPDTGAFDEKVVVQAMTAVFEKAGDGVLITHSAGGGPGWGTAMASSHVKGVIALEPGTFPFPAKGTAVSMDDFMKLTRIPIIVYFGDNIPKGDTPVANWSEDNWRVRWNLAKKWEAVMNKYGGHVQVVSLPDIGIKGNTHFMMADLNNEDVANAMEKWMKENGLAK
ncbi:MAG: alpha/beta fold hydrolase [Megasphaera elsdenii]|uniref:alpha/beta hydrolase n=1 Tax=Megasphaera elsdenii TaxID=907 RepID=UPI0006C79E8E|nr:alpha/beta fold hydrolase [Megasphaera elsdenii]ALG42777.1 alpha/beta hydrolase [Megasphaera elsdenii 14-14]MCI7111549.1 alpha/beta fold hydrolase [Megasphaera elsdenii]MDD7157200.1 alpha/beta fold hydrolase [Megasphaera elsdenii]MDY3269982.1 alpha/beta fold hydrolase [Megasphaera elsdenii]